MGCQQPGGENLGDRELSRWAGSTRYSLLETIGEELQVYLMELLNGERVQA